MGMNMNVIGGILGFFVGGALGIICGTISIVGINMGIELSTPINTAIFGVWTIGGCAIGTYVGSNVEVNNKKSS